jgi:hypothetical protein
LGLGDENFERSIGLEDEALMIEIRTLIKEGYPIPLSKQGCSKNTPINEPISKHSPHIQLTSALIWISQQSEL